MTITEFLLARIAEDESNARRAANWSRSSNVEGQTITVRYSDGFMTWGETFVTLGPERVLAECEAKRRIVEEASLASAKCPEDDWPDDPSDGIEWAPMSALGRHLLRALAAVYADHPDYDQEWAL